MLFGKGMLAAVPFVASLVAASPAALDERDVCISFNGPVIQVYITTQTVNVPVIINTYIPTNGAFIAGGTTINVINAPTQIVTVVNSVSTVTNSQTATITTAPNGQSVQVGPTFNIINFPVYINTFVQQNTIINNQGATIIVNNAPTSIITTATGTITQTVTTTSTITSNVPQATVIVQVAGPNSVVKKGRRQNTVSGYLAADGSLASSCSNAAVLTIEDSELFVDNTSQQYSAGNNDTVITFAASNNVKALTTVFGYNNGGLSWTNTNFANNGSAVFFIQNNFLRAQLQGTAPVAPASLQTISAVSCVSGSIVTLSSTTSSTTTTGASTTTTPATTTATTTGGSSSTTVSTTVITTAVVTTITTPVVTTITTLVTTSTTTTVAAPTITF